MYEVIETKVAVDGREGVTYGLRHTDGTMIEDVSPNRAEVEHMAERFNEMGLAPYQLNDVLTDMVDTSKGYEM